MLARQGRRAAFGALATIFAVIVLALAEVAGWQVLRFYFVGIHATLILLGINLIIAAIFGAIAGRSSPGREEREALRVRQDALTAARGALSITAAIPIGRLAWNYARRRRR
jgi:hypothetical protein